MLEEYKKTININYQELSDRFIQANSPLQKEMVYEPVKKPLVRKPKNSNRFVVYEVEVQMFRDVPYIRVGGWFLDLQNVPLIWKTYTVWGPQFLEPTEFTLSANQTHLPPPQKLRRKWNLSRHRNLNIVGISTPTGTVPSFT
ncbi:hypothetical protein BWI97_08785 [Siphonobacter sp. BAB-5405]|nr:hypothetical protein BWI97_08785 [Siphonobacter sp. BAB-5405]